MLVADDPESSSSWTRGSTGRWSAARLGLGTSIGGFAVIVGCLSLCGSAAADQATTLSGDYTGVSETQPSGQYCPADPTFDQLVDPLRVTVSGTNITLDATFSVLLPDLGYSSRHGSFVGNVAADNSFTATLTNPDGSGGQFSAQFVQDGRDIRLSGTLTENFLVDNAPQIGCVHQVSAHRTITGADTTGAPADSASTAASSTSVAEGTSPNESTSGGVSDAGSSGGGIDPLIPIAILVAIGGGIGGVIRSRRNTATDGDSPGPDRLSWQAAPAGNDSPGFVDLPARPTSGPESLDPLITPVRPSSGPETLDPSAVSTAGSGQGDPPGDDEDVKSYVVVASAQPSSIRGDGQDASVVSATVVDSWGNDVTSAALISFDIAEGGDAATIASVGPRTASVVSNVVLAGPDRTVGVRCTAVVGPVAAAPDWIELTVTAANTEFRLDLPDYGGFGTGEGTVAVATHLRVFGEDRTDYTVNFGCEPAQLMLRTNELLLDPGPSRSTSLNVPRLVIGEAAYRVSASGFYMAGAESVQLNDTKMIRFSALRPELCLTPSKTDVIGDGQDGATIEIKGVYGANGNPFTLLSVVVDPPRLGSCPSPLAGDTATTFVGPLLDGDTDEAITIAAHAKTAGDDGEVDLTAQITLTVLGLASHLSVTAEPKEALANGGNQIMLRAVLWIRGRPEPAPETTWEIAPVSVNDPGHRYGSIPPRGDSVPYRVPLLVATDVCTQKITARYQNRGLDLRAEVTVDLQGLHPDLMAHLEPDTDEVRADGHSHDIVVDAQYMGYLDRDSPTGFRPRDLSFSLIAGEGQASKQNDWAGSYQSPDAGTDQHDDVATVVHVTVRVIGDDAPAPGVELGDDVRFTLRYPNPGCRVAVNPAAVRADGTSSATVSAIPLLYGCDARDLGATVEEFTLQPSAATVDGAEANAWPNLGRMGPPDRTALTTVVSIFHLTETFDLELPATVTVSLDGKIYRCQGAALLHVTGEQPELSLQWRAEDQQGAPRPSPVADTDCWIRVTAKASAYGGGMPAVLSEVSFQATLSDTAVTPVLVDATTVRVPLGLLLEAASLEVTANAVAQGYPLSKQLTLDVAACCLQIRQPESGALFDIFSKASFDTDDPGGGGQVWNGVIKAGLAARPGDAVVRGRPISVSVQAFAEDVPATDGPRTIRDFDARPTAEDGLAGWRLTRDQLIGAMKAWADRPPGITLRVQATATDDHQNSVTATSVVHMRKPTPLNLTIPERIEEHVGDRVSVQTTPSPQMTPSPDGVVARYRWTLIAIDRDRQQRPFDTPDQESGAGLSFGHENFGLREVLHNIDAPRADATNGFRQDDPQFGEIAAEDRLEYAALNLEPLAEALDEHGVVIASSSPSNSFRRVVWDDWCPRTRTNPEDSGTLWYLFRHPILFIHGILGSILVNQEGLTVWPAPDEFARDLRINPGYSAPEHVKPSAVYDFFDFLGAPALAGPDLVAPAVEQGISYFGWINQHIFNRFPKRPGDLMELMCVPGLWRSLLRRIVPALGFGSLYGDEVKLGFYPLGQNPPAPLRAGPGPLAIDPISTDGMKPAGLLRYVPPGKECYGGLLRFFERTNYAPSGTADALLTVSRPSRALRLMCYDWRLDNRKHLPRVQLFLDDLLQAYYGNIQFTRPEDRRVILIAHSMGGLVTRWFHSQCPADFDSKIAWFITLGTPHQGAAEPLMCMLSGIQSNGIVELILNQFPETGLEMAARMPANAQLMAFDREFLHVELPDGSRLSSDAAGVEDTIKQAYALAYPQLVKQNPRWEVRPKPRDFTVLSDEQRAILADAREFQKTIKAASPPRLIHFAGMNRDTTSELILSFEVKRNEDEFGFGLPDLTKAVEAGAAVAQVTLKWDWITGKGDGTVPGWGLAMHCHRLYTVRLGSDLSTLRLGNIFVHRSLGSDGAIQDALTKIFAGALLPGNSLGHG